MWWHLMPAVYYTRIAVGCFSGVGLTALRPELLILAGYACALFCAGLSAVHQEAIGMNRDDLGAVGAAPAVMLGKELRQLLRDRVLLAFIVYAFSVDIFLAASGVGLQLNRAATVVGL